MTDAKWLRKVRWRALVVDEAHRLKNKSSKLAVELAQYRFDHCLMLTGTPLQNNTEELWALLHFMDPKAFASLESFQARFGDLKKASQVEALHALLRPRLLRRVKENVEKSLPDKEETIIEARFEASCACHVMPCAFCAFCLRCLKSCTSSSCLRCRRGAALCVGPPKCRFAAFAAFLWRRLSVAAWCQLLPLFLLFSPSSFLRWS